MVEKMVTIGVKDLEFLSMSMSMPLWLNHKNSCTIDVSLVYFLDTLVSDFKFGYILLA